MKINANYDPHDVIGFSPDRKGPEDLLHSLGLMQVSYYDFDGVVRQGQIIVAIKVMAEVDAFFRQAFEMKFPFQNIVPVSAPEYHWDTQKLLAGNVTYGFDYRMIAGTEKLSPHAAGLAFDVNPVQNPGIRGSRDRKTYLSENPGTLTADHPLVMLMEGFGWEWGGNNAHFQKDL